jgi:hypothetical protein
VKRKGEKFACSLLVPSFFGSAQWNRASAMRVGKLHTNHAARMASRAENGITGSEYRRSLMQNGSVSDRLIRPGEELLAIGAHALQARETTPTLLSPPSIFVCLQ